MPWHHSTIFQMLITHPDVNVTLVIIGWGASKWNNTHECPMFSWLSQEWEAYNLMFRNNYPILQKLTFEWNKTYFDIADRSTNCKLKGEQNKVKFLGDVLIKKGTTTQGRGQHEKQNPYIRLHARKPLALTSCKKWVQMTQFLRIALFIIVIKGQGKDKMCTGPNAYGMIHNQAAWNIA